MRRNRMIAGNAAIPLRCSGVFRGGELRGRFGLGWVWHPPEDSTGTRYKKDKRYVNCTNRLAPSSSFLVLPQNQLFQLRADRILARGDVPAYLQHIRLAAHLAVFDILLSHAGGRVHAGFIPLPASCALKARRHVLV